MDFHTPDIIKISLVQNQRCGWFKITSDSLDGPLNSLISCAKF